MASFGPSNQKQCGERPGGFTRLTPKILDWVKYTSRMSCGLNSSLEMTDTMPMLNGSETEPHQFPWTVFLLIEDKKNGQKSFCGGSLITQKHILTTASCVFGRTIDEIGGILGAHAIKELKKLNLMNISDINIYPDYDGNRTGEFRHSPDVAVLQLEDSVQFSPNIRPICLPSQLTTRNLFVEDKQAILAGWNIIGPANAKLYTGIH